MRKTAEYLENKRNAHSILELAEEYKTYLKYNRKLLFLIKSIFATIKSNNKQLRDGILVRVNRLRDCNKSKRTYI